MLTETLCDAVRNDVEFLFDGSIATPHDDDTGRAGRKGRIANSVLTLPEYSVSVGA
jgi:hypothetical protein